jgi:hypothetical protein
LARKSADRDQLVATLRHRLGIEADEVKPINGGFDAQREK